MELEEAALNFAENVQNLLDEVLPGERTVQAEEGAQRFVVRTQPEWVPLTVREQHLAGLRISFSCCADSSGSYLAVAESVFILKSVLTNTPLVRLEYDRSMRKAPTSHWQIHDERGAFSHLLAHAQSKAPHDLSSLHFPVGGARYRPSLEDFLQFLVRECGVDAEEGWESSVNAGREGWRLRQVATLVRDAPTEAVRALEELGYVIEPSGEGHKATNVASLRRC